jgi:hypothetical protein
MKLYAGIDLHANNSVVVVLDEQDHMVYQKRLRNDLAEILQALGPYQGALQGVVVESTYNWYWLGGRAAGSGLPGTLGKHGGHSTIRGIEIHR